MCHKFFPVILLAATFVSAQTTQTVPPSSSTQKIPTVNQTVEVTATRLPEDPQDVPAAIQVFSGDELRARGVSDLRGALSLATGVVIASGGDAGPASSVPEFWGLKEFDAFLLVVDGVPWGGTFNPALTSLNLSDVERIEVLRGPAPVTYGATSFVGVIQVVHKSEASKDKTLDFHAGSYGSGGAAFSAPIPLPGEWKSRLTVEGERLGFSDDRTDYRRGHGLYRVGRNYSAGNRVWFSADFNWLDQNPASPRPREGATLSPNVPVDSNQNMDAAFLNDHRGTFMGGFDRQLSNGSQWSTVASVSPGRQDAFRGFLVDISNTPDNAHGFREKINFTDFYIDSHWSKKVWKSVRLLAGVDYLHGSGFARGADFDYTTPLNGPAATVAGPDDLDFHINDQRHFFGAYTSAEWSPFERLRFDAGIRLNVTNEHQLVVDGGAGTSEEQSLTKVRPSGSVGAVFTAWQQKQSSINLFVNYRDTYKPAAIDFGIGEDEGGGGDLILKPETSRSVEGGLKSRFFDNRMEFEASGFLMNFNNLVMSADIGGVPGLINAGKQRFKGFETGASFFVRHNVIARANYSYHDAKFVDFVQDFGGTLTQLAGNNIEMSAHHLAGVGVDYAPNRGLFGGVEMNYVGERFLNMRNTALAGGFATVGLRVGFRTPRWELRADALNLGDRRDPIAESEFGDAQYYLQPGRRVDVGLRFHF